MGQEAGLVQRRGRCSADLPGALSSLPARVPWARARAPGSMVTVALCMAERSGQQSEPRAEGGGMEQEPSVPRSRLPEKQECRGTGWPTPPWGFLRALQRPSVLLPRTGAWVPGAVRPRESSPLGSEASLPSASGKWSVYLRPLFLRRTPQSVPKHHSCCYLNPPMHSQMRGGLGPLLGAPQDPRTPWVAP